MKKDLVEKIFKTLKPCSKKNVPLIQSAISIMPGFYLDMFYSFLMSTRKKEKKSDTHRPKCPAEDSLHVSLARYPYKKAMVDYISQWGYVFEDPASITVSLLEATANYLEDKC